MTFGYEISMVTSMAIAVSLALGLNLISGFCGQISLGHAAFYGTGAYCAAMLTTSGLPFFPALAAGSALAALVGVIVGFASLRVRHDFLAITTMGVGLLFVGVVRKQQWLGGEMGLAAIPDPGLGSIGFMLLALAVATACAVFSVYLRRSWMGFSFQAIAEDEDTARMVGVDVPRYKLAAFALGTAMAGLAGALYAHDVKFIAPDSFGIVESISVLAMVVVGGIGSVFWVVVAATVLTALPLWLQFIQDYKLLLYGGLLLLVMLLNPRGLAGLWESWRARAARRR
jgi:branched-chain amino acid transport system permease protein